MTCTYAAYKRPTSEQEIYTDWKWRDGKKIFQANGHEKTTGVAIVTLEKLDFKTKAITRDKEGHYIILKRAV